MLPVRADTASKFDCGRALIICGSERYIGAPFFASQAAVNSGCGLCYLSVPKEILPILGVKLNEPIFLPRGEIDLNAKYDACLIGCGLSRNQEAEDLTKNIVVNAKVPTVVDADSLYFLAQDVSMLKSAGNMRVLTPHEGEFKRFVPDFTRDRRVEFASNFAKENRCILVLKGANTVVSDVDGATFVNTTGNSGMAKGGSGDVLAGLIVSLIAQGMQPIDAAKAGVYIHGLAGDLAREEFGTLGMTPTDTLFMIKKALRNV
ncbi:MAG: NAD(P)H-hydrate dehydratase [Clostridia bacterium]|nr:NAD(P)H-hydrate dehydratase [Clostridia bacterium]